MQIYRKTNYEIRSRVISFSKALRIQRLIQLTVFEIALIQSLNLCKNMRKNAEINIDENGTE